MKIDLSFYENLPETISSKEVEFEVNRLIQYRLDGNSDTEGIMKAWEIIADKQYHTYKLPSNKLKEKVYCWIAENWIENAAFLERLGIIIGSFALEEGVKLLIEKLKTSLSIAARNEIEATIREAESQVLNPYHDLKKQEPSS